MHERPKKTKKKSKPRPGGNNFILLFFVGKKHNCLRQNQNSGLRSGQSEIHAAEGKLYLSDFCSPFGVIPIFILAACLLDFSLDQCQAMKELRQF